MGNRILNRLAAVNPAAKSLVRKYFLDLHIPKILWER